MTGLEFLQRNRCLTKEDIAYIRQYFFVLSGCRDIEILKKQYGSASDFKHALVEKLNSFRFVYDLQVSDKSSFRSIFEAMLNVRAEFLIIEYYHETGGGYEITEVYDEYNHNDSTNYLDWAWNMLFDIDEEDY